MTASPWDIATQPARTPCENILQQIPLREVAVRGDHRTIPGIPEHTDVILFFMSGHGRADLPFQTADGKTQRVAAVPAAGGQGTGQASADQPKFLVGLLPDGLLK